MKTAPSQSPGRPTRPGPPPTPDPNALNPHDAEKLVRLGLFLLLKFDILNFLTDCQVYPIQWKVRHIFLSQVWQPEAKFSHIWLLLSSFCPYHQVTILKWGLYNSFEEVIIPQTL